MPKKEKKKYHSLLYPWQRKPKTEEEDLKLRLKQVSRVKRNSVGFAIGLAILGLITLQWAVFIMVVIFLLFYLGAGWEKKQVESKLKSNQKK